MLRILGILTLHDMIDLFREQDLICIFTVVSISFVPPAVDTSRCGELVLIMFLTF